MLTLNHRAGLALLSYAVAIVLTSPLARAAPTLALVKTGTAATASDSIVMGTLEYTLDVKLDTGGDPVSGLQFYLTNSDPSLRFGLSPIAALDNPFTQADIFGAPGSGGKVNQTEGTTVLFKSGAGDYPAFSSRAIVSFTFDVSHLSAGDYLLTPVGEELTFTNTTRTTFAAPGGFVLNVQPVPEPSTLTWTLVLTAASGLARIRRPGGR
jgi:hypothetical protein